MREKYINASLLSFFSSFHSKQKVYFFYKSNFMWTLRLKNAKKLEWRTILSLGLLSFFWVKLGYTPRNPKMSKICPKNKNRKRTIWGFGAKKSRKAEPHQNFTGSYKKCNSRAKILPSLVHTFSFCLAKSPSLPFHFSCSGQVTCDIL